MYYFANGINIGPSGKTGPNKGQIQFPATQNSSSGANVLDDYEEGSWTPNDASGAGLGFTLAVGLYVKIGRIVVIHGTAQYPATASGASARIGGLPFTTDGTANQDGAITLGFCNRGADTHLLPRRNTTYIELFNDLANGIITNANMTGALIQFAGCYLAGS